MIRDKQEIATIESAQERLDELKAKIEKQIEEEKEKRKKNRNCRPSFQLLIFNPLFLQIQLQKK